VVVAFYRIYSVERHVYGKLETPKTLERCISGVRLVRGLGVMRREGTSMVISGSTLASRTVPRMRAAEKASPSGPAPAGRSAAAGRENRPVR